jgi:hypothetical protein
VKGVLDAQLKLEKLTNSNQAPIYYREKGKKKKKGGQIKTYRGGVETLSCLQDSHFLKVSKC